MIRRFLYACLYVFCAVGMVDAAADSENWVESVPSPRVDFGFDRLHFETSFSELRPSRLAPLNTKTAVGVPGWPVLGFGYLMRARYSEFSLRFTVQGREKEKLPHTLGNFRQMSPGDWLPGAVSEWDDQGVHYRITYIVVPHEPQPVDLYQISIRNTAAETRKGNMLVTLDGAPTLAINGDLISDRGKPLVVMEPAVEVERIARRAGCVDPRATPSGTWGFGSMRIDEWRTHRDGWYGMPIEYLLQPSSGASLQVFLGFEGTPPASSPNWDVPLSEEEPAIAELYSTPEREVIATVEGDPAAQRARLPRHNRVILSFNGRDTDGDGYVRISVRATPESRQPAVLAMLWAFDSGQPITKTQLLLGNGAGLARYRIDVGEDLPWDIAREVDHLGADPTVFALRLRYEPKLAPQEEKTYLLKLPAIDKPEVAPYGNAWRPYDTGESWKTYMEPRHPENTAPYGEEVPAGVSPADFAAFGPKSRQLWSRQLIATRQLSWQEGMKRLVYYWNSFISNATRFLTPEPCLDSLYKHQLAILDLHRIRFAPTSYELQLTGPDWYWDIAISRDVPYMYLAWDWAGYPEKGRSSWNTLLTPRSQLPRSRWTLGQWEGGPEHDGLWVTRSRQWDGQGQILWGLFNHYQTSGDRQWLYDNYPKIRRGADWIVQAIQRERERLGRPEGIGYGLLPPANGESGGFGHNYYVNSFAVLGLRMAAQAAQVMGEEADVVRFSQLAEDLKQALHRAIQAGFVRFNDFAGTIPTGPEWSPGPTSFVEREGRRISIARPTSDFGCPLVWPTDAVGPFNLLMNGWNQYREYEAQTTAGLFDWPYIGVDWGISYIRRGEPDRAADWFYAYVDNASGTLDWGENMTLEAPFSEFTPPKTGIRAEGQMPHGWASAMYISYLRNLLLHEEGDSLHLAPATPRKWLAQSQPVGVEQAPTQFGKITYHLIADPDRTTIRGDVQLDPNRKPARLFIHVRGPGGRGLSSVRLNGEKSDVFFRDTIIIVNPADRIQVLAKYQSD